MRRKLNLAVAAASLMMAATSCSQDELQTSNLSASEIGIHASMGLKTRATETTIVNLGNFKVNAFQEGKANYMKDVEYASSDKGSSWTTSAGSFFWPVEGKLHFYAYAPAVPGQAGTFQIDKDVQSLSGFVPNAAAADQKDFVYVKATGDAATNGATGIDLNFLHALSEITITAKNSNTAYTVEVTGVKIGNVVSKGTFTFPSTSDAAASWNLSSDASDVKSYETSWNSSVALGSEASSLDAANVAFMLLPQQLEKASKASDKAYVALKVKITMQGGDVIHDGWSYIGIDTNWEMGKHYAYTLDFSNGAGQKDDGSDIVSGKAINMNVSVTPWDEDAVPVPAPHLYNANCVILDNANVGKVYGIDISRANTFWSNPDVGDASNVIDNNTEWTAEVIWQDIPARSINFCSAGGSVVSGDTYNGKGLQPLYVKAATSTSGNVIVGIKKKGAGSDAYLWSWHLWLTEEPKEISGFMDRNLGATSAMPSDSSKTYGLYYQFGRKDPFVGDTNIYDINGQSFYKSIINIKNSNATIAESVSSPTIFYTGNGKGWERNYNYTKHYWYDLQYHSPTNDNYMKAFFDPCPEGWRLESVEGMKTVFKNYTRISEGIKTNGLFFPYSNCIGADGLYKKINTMYMWHASYKLFDDDYYDYNRAIMISPSKGTDVAYGSRAIAFPCRCVPEE